ncbi:conserved hypothetical protein [Porphyromonas gingivalis TDC60]|uniref:hypothetical protein n=1 Tax=Porphyromonas gingivalis TaxID=837 RepID=UPI00020F03F1|nr:hypothetical protein [Porphyromonas gingivalis]BAK26090.1 conserved hypothetical protein [Porphyromonas gingivalis TDC60]
MNNETAPILDILEELKQECKAIKTSQAELRTALVEQQNTKPQAATQVPQAVHLQLSQETKAKIKEHQLFVLAALEESSKKLDPKFEVLQKLISEQQKPVMFKNYSLFAGVRLAERILLGLVCGLVMVSCWFFAMGAHELETASDYDLRYRYLRMQGKVTASDFAHLDSMFVSHRNPQTIYQLEQKVIAYEQALQRQAELLMEQKRIQQEQGELKKHLKK